MLMVLVGIIENRLALMSMQDVSLFLLIPFFDLVETYTADNEVCLIEVHCHFPLEVLFSQHLQIPELKK